MPETIHGFRDGDPVRHPQMGVGRVGFRREIDPDPTKELTAEVFFASCVIYYQLTEALAASLEHI